MTNARVYLAFPAPKRDLLSRVFRWRMRVPFDHIELLLCDGPNGSAPTVVGCTRSGVRSRRASFNISGRWNFIRLNITRADEVWRFYERTSRDRFSWLGLAAMWFHRSISRRGEWTCLSWAAAALGLSNPEQLTYQALMAQLQARGDL